MDLYILRHAIAEERAAGLPGGDSQRRLTEEGKRKMHRAAKGMKDLDLEFDLILSSPFLRAKETAEIVAEVFELNDALKLTPSLAADGNPKDLIDDLRGHYHKRKRVLLVGHEPYLSRLISLLISGDTAIAITLKKAAFANSPPSPFNTVAAQPLNGCLPLARCVLCAESGQLAFFGTAFPQICHARRRFGWTKIYFSFPTPLDCRCPTPS